MVCKKTCNRFSATLLGSEKCLWNSVQTPQNGSRECTYCNTDLKRLLACMHKLVTFEFTTFHEGFATLSTHMNTRAVRVQVLSHTWIISKHLITALMGTGNCSWCLIRSSFWLKSANRHIFYLIALSTGWNSEIWWSHSVVSGHVLPIARWLSPHQVIWATAWIKKRMHQLLHRLIFGLSNQLKKEH